MRGGRRSERDEPPARQACLRQDARVVGVRDGGGGFAQGVEQLALRVCDALERSRSFQVHGTDVCDQPDVGIRPRREARDLAQVVHPRLDHGVAVLRGEAQQRERHAHFVVEIALGLESGPDGVQDGTDQLLGGGLPRRSGDAHELQIVQALAPGMSQIAKGATGIHGR